MNRFVNIFSVLALAITLQACAGVSSYSSLTDFERAAASEYTLDSGDKVRVSVFGQVELNNTYSVDGSGAIALPLIGAVKARGASVRQLEQIIAVKLAQKFIKNPNVTVEIDTYRPFFILGEVASSGQYSFVSGMTAQTAVAIGGGFSPRAVQDKIEVTRVVNGVSKSFVVPIATPIRPGDTLKVLERFI